MSKEFEAEALTDVARYLETLQARVCAALERLEPSGKLFVETGSSDERSQGWARVLAGDTFERAAVHRTAAGASSVPPTLLERRPELAGCGFDAHSLSIIVHPTNPYVPTVHANLRFFVTRKPGDGMGEVVVPPEFWFGGGFDLTPCYGFEEDAVHWHRTARDSCLPFGEDLYPRFKKACDEYFFLPHRNEGRGIGGILFDDLDSLSPVVDEPREALPVRFERCFELVKSIGNHLLPAYVPLVERRTSRPYGDRERSFQSYRRGRYVEFNLLYDRGTRYGLKVGRRTESVLSSLPPRAEWRNDWQPEPGSDEARLYERFLGARDWVEGSTGGES